MAQISAFSAFDLDDLDLHRLFATAINAQLQDNEFASLDSIAYPDVFEVTWNGGAASTSFGGTDIAYDPSSLTITGGTVNGIVEAHNGALTYAIHGLAVSARALFEAALTSSTTDDTALIREALSGADTFLLSSGADRARGYDGNDILYGHGSDDTLFGDAGDDVLDGGTGVDRLEGGTGDDTYVLTEAGDTVVEAANAGTDMVQASYSVTLGENLEALVLTGAAALTGTGNSLANVLTGNTGANTLKGLDGADSLYGGVGNDTLDGGAGGDRLEGGANDDLFIVDAVGDVVVEGVGGGVDQVSAAVSHTLGSEVENLLLTGSASIHGTGNGLANRVTGNAGSNNLTGGAGNDSLYGGAGHDTLDGGTGTDRLEGGAGNDIYLLATSGDTVVEVAGGGTDQVNAAFTTNLATNVENLVLTGSAAVNGTGNGLANRLTGNAAANTLLGLDGNDTLDGGSGADVLTGGLGADVLTGGAGSDDFVFNAAAESGLGTQRYTIKSFAKGWDDIALSAIDANTTKSGNQAFTLDAGGVFSAGEIRQTQRGENLLIEMNTDGDAAAEMSILLSNVTGPLGASDFLL